MDTPVLVGRTCCLAGLRPSDAEDWLAGEDGEQLRWFESRASTREDVVRAIGRWRQQWLDEGPMRQWGIWLDDVLAGGVELQVREGGWANVSFVVWPRFRRQGLASEATRPSRRTER